VKRSVPNPGPGKIARAKLALPAEAIARAIVFAIEQPADVDGNEIIVRPTAQS